MKTVLFLVTTQGGGNHLLEEIFTQIDFKRIAHNPIVFWPIYEKVQAEPNATCTNLVIAPKLNATNAKVMEMIYNSWGYDYDLSKANEIFQDIILNKIPDNNLMILHQFEYIHTLGEEAFSWSQDESNSALQDLKESLTHPDISLKFLCILRHPVSLYVSTKNRFGKASAHQQRMDDIISFFKRIEQLEDLGIDYLVYKYEDLCNQPETFLDKVWNWMFPSGSPIPTENVASITYKKSQSEILTWQLKRDYCA